MNAILLAVFLMGLRHGADPDHLAAIDNVTRNVHDRMPRSSRFVGTLFAIGHAAMVIGTATFAGYAGSHLSRLSPVLEYCSAVASIFALLAMAAWNIYLLLRKSGPSFRAKFVPNILRDATHPLAAIPLGALFGLGFETSSQLLAYGAAFSNGHSIGGFLIGALFCAGMICTDTIDSIFVARVVSTRSTPTFDARSPWILAVTVVAIAVASQEIGELFFSITLVDETTLSLASIVLLGLTAFYSFVRRRESLRSS